MSALLPEYCGRPRTRGSGLVCYTNRGVDAFGDDFCILIQVKGQPPVFICFFCETDRVGFHDLDDFVVVIVREVVVLVVEIFLGFLRRWRALVVSSEQQTAAAARNISRLSANENRMNHAG